ncbi:hypothetical protein Y032_0312g2163 [Ancylostoma ceylanicum]|uniref:Uncharacterized protein n=1 Tax=Ancylostoma ceylanicum TaxID=53326 RepID=A0A016S1X5_9BILA|nr:hypothetical protein Y032_0312g2163 [Ancylostoma ceylanicum]
MEGWMAGLDMGTIELSTVCWRYKHTLDLLVTTIPVSYTNRHKTDESLFLKGVEVSKIWSQEVDRSKLCYVAARHRCKVGKRVSACPIDKINGFTRQFGSANCYRHHPGKRV